MFVHSSASGNMNEIFKTHFSPVTLELSLPDAEDCGVHGPKGRHVPLCSTHHVNLENVLCMRLSINPCTMRHSLAFEISPTNITNFVETW